MPMQNIAPPVVRIGGEGERLEFGEVQLVFKSPLPGSKDGWLALDYTMPPHQMGAALHYHKKLVESFYIISGDLTMEIGGREIVAGPGSYVLIPPGIQHGFANRSDAPLRFLAHASAASHKDFLCELFEMIRNERAWPPQDRSKIDDLGQRYDTYYV